MSVLSKFFKPFLRYHVNKRTNGWTNGTANTVGLGLHKVIQHTAFHTEGNFGTNFWLPYCFAQRGKYWYVEQKHDISSQWQTHSELLRCTSLTALHITSIVSNSTQVATGYEFCLHGSSATNINKIGRLWRLLWQMTVSLYRPDFSADITNSQGPDLQKKILGNILSLAYVFPKFILSYKVKIFIDFYM